MLLKIFFFSLFALPLAQAQSPCQAQVGQCGYYSCMAKAFKCPTENYFQNLGQKYCEKFGNYSSELLSSRGQTFVRNLKNCLQEKIERDFSRVTCASIKNLTERHHFECYTDQGYCDLSWDDKIGIFTIVHPALIADHSLLATSIWIESFCAMRAKSLPR